MIPLSVTPDLARNPWTDLGKVLQPGMGTITRMGRLTDGTMKGKSTVALVIQMPNGKQYVAETTMTLFLSAAQAFKAIEDEMSGSNARN